MLHANSEPQYCVVVAEFQNVQVWNKGMEPMTVDWPDGERKVAADEHFDTGPIGEVLQFGPNEIVAVHGDPYSPVFLSEGSGDGTSVTVEIHLHGPHR